MSSWYFWESFDQKSTDQRESWALKVWLLLLSFTCSLPISRAVIFLSFFSFFSLLCTLWEELLWQHESDDTVWHWVWHWHWDPKFFRDNICNIYLHCSPPKRHFPGFDKMTTNPWSNLSRLPAFLFFCLRRGNNQIVFPADTVLLRGRLRMYYYEENINDDLFSSVIMTQGLLCLY